MIDISFSEYACEIKVVDENGMTHILTLQKLYEKIEPDDCKWRFSEGKRISVTFKKWLETKWKTLLKERSEKGGETRLI